MSQDIWSETGDAYSGTCGSDKWQIDLHEE